MATSKVERLVNLVIALLSSRGYITAEKIRKTVHGYEDSPNAEAFSRMFERDKNELRDLGIPLEVGPVSRLDHSEGYRINRDSYALPPVELTADEAAAVAVATELWESPELITATHGALLKLRAAGVDVDDAPVAIATTAVEPGLRGSEEVLTVLLSAIDSRRAVEFPHRSRRTDPYTVRTVEPWGAVTRNGRWYLVGYDRDRADVRVFRLSRIASEVVPVGPAGAFPAVDGVDLRAIVAEKTAEVSTGVQATVWVADGRAIALRRSGRSLGPRRLGDRDGDVIELTIGSNDRLARDIAGNGADAIVLSPDSLRADVLARLQAQADSGCDAETERPA